MNSEPTDLCGCLKCQQERVRADMENSAPMRGVSIRGFRFGCEICGNKRCPHHSDHVLACTNSNEPGQPGSVYPKFIPREGD